MADDSIIIWDDPPSSPFMSEVQDASRAASGTLQAAKSMNGEEEKEEEPEAFVNHVQQTLTTKSLGGMEDDKENSQPEADEDMHLFSTPFKTPFERAPAPSVKATPASVRGQMLPPSTIKRGSSPTPVSTAKRPPPQSPLDEPNPSRPKVSRNNTATSATETVPDEPSIDDTCFSNFSAVPEMTLFAKLGQSPGRPLYQTHVDAQTPRARPRSPPSTASRSRANTANRDETTSLLIDFTQQMQSFTATRTAQRGGFSPSRTESSLLSHLNTQRSPGKPRHSELPTSSSKSNLLNLLDFELPPPPTPRSAPSFSAREVEALKSGFASQLGGIKAKLSGKEAEVESLKKALEDAERRVGESEEKERLERIKREESEREKESWERRGEEVERVLREVKEEVVRNETERESLLVRCEEAEKRADDAEARVTELVDKMARGPEGQVEGVVQDEVHRLVQLQIDGKIESVSRELHAVYKKKHETKVATLKKSYEARGEKKCAELQAKVDDLSRHIEELKLRRDETFSGELAADKVDWEEKRAELDRLRAETEEHVARTRGLETEMETVKRDHARLLSELEAERAEKGDLVAAVDEMLALQATDSTVIEDFKKSLSRPVAARPPPPGMVESRMGRPSGLARPGMGKSKMMSNIERMGLVRNQ